MDIVGLRRTTVNKLAGTIMLPVIVDSYLFQHRRNTTLQQLQRFHQVRANRSSWGLWRRTTHTHRPDTLAPATVVARVRQRSLALQDWAGYTTASTSVGSLAPSRSWCAATQQPGHRAVLAAAQTGDEVASGWTGWLLCGLPGGPAVLLLLRLDVFLGCCGSQHGRCFDSVAMDGSQRLSKHSVLPQQASQGEVVGGARYRANLMRTADAATKTKLYINTKYVLRRTTTSP